MKTSYNNLLPILPLLPLLMANSPVPAPHPTNYEDFLISVSDVQKYSEDIVYYQYSYDIKNIGEGYMSYIYINLRKNDNTYDYDYLGIESIDGVFYDSLIIPHQEITSIGAYKLSEPSIDNYKDVTFSADAYSSFADDVTVIGDYELTAAAYSKNTYQVNISLEGTNKNDYYYGVIFKITYDGQDHCVHSDEKANFSISVMDGFDYTKLTNIEVVKVTKAEAYHSHFGEVIAVIGTIFLVCFAIAISMGIFSAIFFPIMKRKRRARRLAAIQNNDSAKSDK